MPIIRLSIVEDVFSEAEKGDLMKGFTEVMKQVKGERVASNTWVVIEEIKSGDWAINGKPITTEQAKAFSAGRGSL